MSLMANVTRHLEFLGYEMSYIDQLRAEGFDPAGTMDEGTVAATHPKYNLLWLLPTDYGVNLFSMFQMNNRAHKKRLSLLECIDAFNRRSAVLSCFTDPSGFIFFAAYYYGDYNRQELGLLIQLINEDLEIVSDGIIDIIQFIG